MKILVFSDSHGSTVLMAAAVRVHQPDLILHLGDVVQDAMALSRDFPDLPLEYVCGNCDGTPVDIPPRRLIEVEGRRILMTHGHIYGVKSGVGAAVRAAQEEGADMLLFGHTHEPLCDRQGPLWILNPGSIRGGYRPTYGVITLNGAHTDCRTAVAEFETGV